MKQTTIKQIKLGDYFTMKPTDEPTENQVWVKGEYDRSERAYWCYRFADVNSGRLIKASKVVYVEFYF